MADPSAPLRAGAAAHRDHAGFDQPTDRGWKGGFVRDHARAVTGIRHSPVHVSLLSDFLARHARLFVLTGAGCSTDSGIPDYRDANGDWKRSPSVSFQAFTGSARVRQRYWARSFIGWSHIRRARPNRAHEALARLERQGCLELLVTQNVDGLHQAAGSMQVVDLHGRLDRVRCLDCEGIEAREAVQAELARRNAGWSQLAAPLAPDGDADLKELPFDEFVAPSCARCGGILKPDVVFFGENVPRHRVDTAMQGLARADAVLVVGSSLMVYSGYRFVRAAAQSAKPIAAVNLGRTRADELLALKVSEPCAQVLNALSLAPTSPADRAYSPADPVRIDRTAGRRQRP